MSAEQNSIQTPGYRAAHVPAGQDLGHRWSTREADHDDPADRRAVRQGVKMMREVAAQAALARYKGEELHPGDHVRTDAEIDAWVRANGETIYHPVGTCRMGHDRDPQAVLTPDLKVRGVDRLRVIDASIMPTIVSGNTNAAVLGAAAKAADLILA